MAAESVLDCSWTEQMSPTVAIRKCAVTAFARQRITTMLHCVLVAVQVLINYYTYSYIIHVLQRPAAIKYIPHC